MDEEICPLCKHPYEEHDFDIHNADLGEWFGVKPVFPYELHCYGCMEEHGMQSPPPGTTTHDHFMVKLLETVGHYCHIGPLPRWVNSSESSWNTTYSPLPYLVTTSADNRTQLVNVRVDLFGEPFDE